jgi:hypothetical protein
MKWSPSQGMIVTRYFTPHLPERSFGRREIYTHLHTTSPIYDSDCE